MRKNVQMYRDGISLEEFIKDNEAILSSLAVVAALIVFSKDLTPSFTSGAISFLLVGGIVLLWLEMWHKFPERVTWRLYLFRYVLLWSLVGIIFSWLYEYRQVWDMTLFIPMTIIAYWFQADTIVQIINAIPPVRRFFGVGVEQKTSLQKWMRLIAVVVGIFFAFFMGVYLSTGTNISLDVLKYGILKN